MKNLKKESGFTLVEIAIVLVIIGLLLGGILKGQELINSARVRNLADQNSGIQAAYYGFIDRFRKVPGDWQQDAATTGIGQTINSPVDGNQEDNGRIDEGNWEEASAVWEQLSKAGFIQGAYPGGAGDATTYTDSTTVRAPVNAFGGNLLLARTVDFLTADDTISTTARLGLVIGNNIPVKIARELDVKVDDSKPHTGVLRLSPDSGDATDFAPVSESTSTDCVAAGSPDEYDIATDAQNCNLIFLY